MREFFETMALGKPITTRLVWAGEDLTALIFGGDKPHTGSVSVAHWQTGRLEVDTTLLPAHRDDAVSSRFAQALAESTGHTVTALCGIHYDGITRAGITEVLAAAERLLEEITAELNGSGQE